MNEFLLELYVPRAEQKRVEADAERARQEAERMTRGGKLVRFVRTIFVPEDETCFYLFEAASIDVVREIARLAGLRFDRISEAVSEAKRTGDTT